MTTKTFVKLLITKIKQQPDKFTVGYEGVIIDSDTEYEYRPGNWLNNARATKPFTLYFPYLLSIKFRYTIKNLKAAKAIKSIAIDRTTS